MGRGPSPLQLFILRRCAEVGYCARADIKGLYFKLSVKPSVSKTPSYEKLTTKTVRQNLGLFADDIFNTEQSQYDSVCVSISRSIHRLIARGLVLHTYVQFRREDAGHYDFALGGVRLTPSGFSFVKNKFGRTFKPEITSDILEYVTVKAALKVAQGKPIVLTVKAVANLPRGKPIEKQTGVPG
jgi:hypothetical protein